jgi:hypothetical protein
MSMQEGMLPSLSKITPANDHRAPRTRPNPGPPADGQADLICPVHHRLPNSQKRLPRRVALSFSYELDAAITDGVLPELASPRSFSISSLTTAIRLRVKRRVEACQRGPFMESEDGAIAVEYGSRGPACAGTEAVSYRSHAHRHPFTMMRGSIPYCAGTPRFSRSVVPA